jgi:hypothetical protein
MKYNKCSSYYAVTKSTNPRLYNLYLKIGRGDPNRGYNELYDMVVQVKDMLQTLRYVIEESNGVTFVSINKIANSRYGLYKNHQTLQTAIWNILFYHDRFTTVNKLMKAYKLADVALEECFRVNLHETSDYSRELIDARKTLDKIKDKLNGVDYGLQNKKTTKENDKSRAD